MFAYKSDRPGNGQMMLRILVLLTIAAMSALAALPPGFDEEIYCPRGMCMRRKSPNLLRRRETGPRVMFLECFNPSTQESCRPRPWGVQLDREYKDTLIKKGWHTGECTKEEERVDVLKNYMILNSRLDNIIETLAILSFI
jgi:hypothetical protein